MPTKYVLEEEYLPRKWYNIQADLPNPLEPPLHPATGEPVGPEDLSPIFASGLIEQEMSQERYIDIPEEVRDILSLWRPTPLYRAHRLEKHLKTPARIFYKYEGVSPPGSHKPNTAVAQAYYNAKDGVSRITTETGAGQWGSSLAFATSLFDLECTVYMVRSSYDLKPSRRTMMQTWGAECHPSPSNLTASGRAINERYPDTPGSLGIAISEAVEDAATHEDAHYALGSVLNHVCLHQSVIGLEAQQQMAAAGAEPDLIVGCAGGGSNFAGLAFPFVRDKISGARPDLDFLASEPSACPSLTHGLYAYDYGDVAGLTPMLKMCTLGHDFIPPAIHAGGLRYHGESPLVSLLHKEGLIRSQTCHQKAVFAAAVTFARTEGIIIAPETAHAVKTVIDEAEKCRRTGEEKTILFNCSGHGNFDLSSYEAYLAGGLIDYEYPAELIRDALTRLPKPAGEA